MNHPITADEIQDAINSLDAQISEDDLDELLIAIQENIEDFWGEHMAAIEKGNLDLVDESEVTLVFADNTGEFWQKQFDALMEFVNLLGVKDGKIPETVMAAHHNSAYRLTDHNWATVNPVVIKKPANFDNAQFFIEAVINSLLSNGLSPGQAWAYYGVIVRENSRNTWAKRCGYSDHSAVSEAVRKAKNKLEK